MTTRTTSLLLSGLLIFGLAGCDADSAHEKSADTTQQLKQDAKDATVKAKEGARQAGKDLKAMASGVKEGWSEDKNALDLNSCSAQQLTALGLSQKQASLIIQNRPYKMRHDLVSKGVISEQEYKDVEHKVTVK